MSTNKIQLKRTGISGRLPNTTDSSNSAFIDIGELALNFADGILYSSDGTNLIEIGANTSNINITGSLAANGNPGQSNQVLISTQTGISWETPIVQVETRDQGILQVAVQYQ